MPTIKGTVRNQADKTAVPGVAVELFLQLQNQVIKNLNATVDAQGRFAIAFDANSIPALTHSKDIVVFVQVWRNGTESIPVTNNPFITNLELKDYDLDVLVNLPAVVPPPVTPGRFSVEGRITDASGVAAAGLTVTAVDRDMQREEVLGSATTDADGKYQIFYSAAQFTRARKGGAGLVVRVMGPDGKTELGAAPIRFKAKAQEIVDIQLERTKFRGASEYERHVATVRPIIENAPLSGLTDANLEFLTGETDIPFAQLEAIRLDAQWREQNSNRPLPAGVFYGLLRQGLPKTLPALLRLGTIRWREALTQSLANNEVPQALSVQLDQIIQTLTALAVEHAFVPAPESDGGIPPIGVLLAATGLPTAQQQLLAKTSLTLAQNVDEATWTKTLHDAGVTKAAVDHARFAIQTHIFVDKHLPTLVHLQETVAKTYSSVADLAQLSRTQWVAVAKGLEPKKQLPKGFTDAVTYGQSLANSIEALFPTKVLAHHLTTTKQPLRQAVGHFMLANPSFDLLRSPVDSFVATAKMDGISVPREELNQQLGKEARLARLTPLGDRSAQIEQLLASGLDSAVKIAAKGRHEFKKAVSHTVSNVRAEEIYRNASDRVNEMVLRGIQMGELVFRASPMLPGTASAPMGELATWAAMFGHGNGCSCSPCESAHGPAAYLMDLFEFLKDKDADGVADGKTLQDILFERRPDLQYLLLNCANAETPLPYIDLVIEHLERLAATAPNSHLNYEAGTTPQTPESLPDVDDVAARLRALPMQQSATTAIYKSGGALAEAVYPWNLPFDRSHLEASVYFNSLGVTPADVLGLKSTADDDLHRARLGLSRGLWSKLHLKPTNPARLSGIAVARVWGGTGRANRLNALHRFGGENGLLARSGLDANSLFRLIESPLFSGWGLMVNRSETDPCNIKAAQLRRRLPTDSEPQPLGSRAGVAVFDLMHRVLRLRLALNWPLARLLQALHALGVGSKRPSIDLVALSRLVWMSSKLGVSVEYLSALLIALDQQSADSAALAHAQQAWLAMLKLSPEDHTHLLALRLEDTLTTTINAPLRLERLEQVHAKIDLLRAADLDPAELRYLLRDRDVVPPVFTPRGQDVDAHLGSLVVAIQDVGVDPPPVPKLPAGATEAEQKRHQQEELGRASAVAELGWLRVRAVTERLSEITGATWINHVITDVPDRVPLVASDTDRTRGAVHDFIALAAVLIPPDPVREPVLYQRYKQLRIAARQSLRRVLKAARLLVMLKATPEDVEAVAQLTRDNGIWLDFNTLPLAPLSDEVPLPNLSTIMGLVQASVVQAGMPKADRRLLDIIAGSTTGEDPIAGLEANTAWGRSLAVKPDEGAVVLKQLIATLGFSPTKWWSLPSTLATLQRAVRWLQQRRIKVSPDRNELKVLLNAAIATGDEPNPADEPAGSGPITALRHLARSRFARERDYYSAITPAMDRLRIAHRDALLAYILHASPRWTTADDVYAHVLIDVQMGPCQLTSRIVQAHSTVQLFVQRCLMNLETRSGVSLGNVSDIAGWRQWEWMKNYRVWEAGRKVFLYPENWIEPDLRDVKSPFFEELENELLQDEITPDNAERAVRGYLTKLHEVARLDIRALYEEEYSEPLGNGRTVARRVIHMVGRTHAVPHVYYYRKRLDNLTWTPWEKIELTIDSDHLVLAVHNRRPMLLWLQFREVQENRADPSSTAWEVRLSWSRHHQGRWEAPRSSSEFLNIRPSETILKSVVLRTAQDGRDLSAILYRPINLTDLAQRGLSGPALVLFGPLLLISLQGTPFDSGAFYFQACSEKIRARVAGSDGALRGLARPEGTVLIENKLVSVHETPSPFFLTIDETQESVYLQNAGLTILTTAGQRFEITPTHQYSRITAFQPIIYADNERQFIATNHQSGWFPFSFAGQFVVIPVSSGYQFETLYHPYSCLLLKAMDEEGLAGLYRSPERLGETIEYTGTPPERFPRQRIHEVARAFEDKYKPTGHVWKDETRAPFVYPIEEFDFTAIGAYSLYNWELFFHVPLLLADRLSKAGKYQDAQQWFHSIFDPTDVSSHNSPQKYWRVRPLFEEAERWQGAAESLETILRKLSLGAEDVKSQVEDWRSDPFNPHLLARLRLVAYMKTVVQKYIENLIAWADSLFRRDTIESINEATQLYVLGSEILGVAPTLLSPLTRIGRSYADLQRETTIDEFANGLGRFENAMPIASGHASTTAGLAPGLSMLYFCIPSNPRLRELRATIDDRLFKIRHCMDIDGRARQLALFAPPIDPALLVRARAAGLDIGTVLDMALGNRQSPYRFQPLLQKALEFTNEVRSFGGALLSALEKRDGEQLAQLRARHEVSLLKLVSETKRQQIEEAEKQLEAVKQSRVLAEARLKYYTSREFMSAGEISQVSLLSISQLFQTTAQSIDLAAAVAHGFPDVIIGMNPNTKTGGSHIGNALGAASGVSSIGASLANFGATVSSIMAGHERRQDEWDFQAELAEKELDQIKQQIEAAEIRLDIAKQEQRNHEQQIAQAEQSEAFLRDKFTNAQLYNWMSAQLSALHYQAYRMAFDLAKQAEAAAHREVDTPNNIIRFDHWDSGRKGLLAGERLGQDLRRLEVAYMEHNTRQLEITSNISLRRLDPKVLWDLRLEGVCTFTLPTWLFDMDFPGHQRRRIKSVSVSAPGVVGPYGGVNGILQCQQGIDIRTIATSSGQNDAGVFQLDFRDERYLPFEGISLDPDPSDGIRNTHWSFSLPAGNRPFDYETISDLVLHVQYTARPPVTSVVSQSRLYNA